SRSYVWTGARILAAKAVAKAASATAVMTRGLMKYRNLVYSSDPSMVVERVKKVTITRHSITPPEYLEAVIQARKAASQVSCEMWTPVEVGHHTPSKSARSQISGLTAADVRCWSRKAQVEVRAVLDQIEEGRLSGDYAQVVVVPKIETFVKTPKKPTMKPPRLIAYPHLEVRVAEKMYLGDVAQRVAKAVVGEAYGFQYSPKQRVDYLLRAWRSKASPFGFTFDTHCFDSNVTPDDIATEASIFTSAQMSDKQRDGIRVLSKCLYETSDMVNIRGEKVGERFCRASGTYTTSAGNTITCFLKAKAAAKMAGIKRASFLIHGDDCLVIAESDSPSVDARKVGRFAAAMKAMGCVPGDIPVARYSLELLDTCSSNVSVATTKSSRPYYYLTRDPSIPLARASAEGQGYNTSGSWVGYLVANYPAIWSSRVLGVHLCDILLNTEDLPETMDFDWYGNKWSVPLNDLPEIIAALHGKQAFETVTYSPFEVSRISAALRDLGMGPLRHWKRRARQVRAECMRRGGALRRLASRLLWFAGRDTPQLDEDTIARYASFRIFDVYSDPESIKLPSKREVWRKRVLKAMLVMAGAFVALLLLKLAT
nr:RNA-dependent RNA polymerase NS5B [Hepacivirus vittatae]